MSLEHTFSIIAKSSDREKIYSTDVYNYYKDGTIKKINSIKILDEFLQKLLYDSSGFPYSNLKFSEWGIDVYEQNNLLKWIDFLKDSKNKVKQDNKICQKMLLFMEEAKRKQGYVIHFGI